MNTKSLAQLFTLPLSFIVLTIFTCHAYSQPGRVDAAFQPAPSSLILPPTGPTKGQILQPDGKLIIWVGNLVVKGVAKGQIARLNSDGSLDTSFTYCSCHMRSVRNVVLQPDGKLLVAGADFESKAKVVRLNSDGSTDVVYNAQLPPTTSSSSYVWFVQADGKSYIQVDETLGFGMRRIYRVNPDGTLDTGFTPIVLAYDRTNVADFLLQSGYLYVVSNFGNISSSSAFFQRFDLNGAEDTAWQKPSVSGGPGNFFSYVNDLEFQPDGSLLLSGRFTTVNGFQKSNLARILPAGNVDLSFTPPSVLEGGFVETLGNGKLLWSPSV
ncbi:MAG: hypothetical protein ABJB34_13000, partial [Acidobacteriota bacterium]